MANEVRIRIQTHIYVKVVAYFMAEFAQFIRFQVLTKNIKDKPEPISDLCPHLSIV